MAAPVNGQVDSSNEAGSVGGQEGDALGHFVHLPWSTKGMGLLTLGKKLVVKKIEGYKMLLTGSQIRFACDHF